jgi:hypothetical protein
MTEKGIIRLRYRKIIHADASQQWEKYVFNDSYAEFLLQVQTFNRDKKYTVFSELIAHEPNAEKLHFLVSASIVGYLRQFGGKLPDIVNGTGELFVPFKNFRFEIIESDTRDKSRHQVAINFVSEPMVWHDTIGDRLLLSVPGQQTEGDEVLTELLAMQPFLSIHSLKKTG